MLNAEVRHLVIHWVAVRPVKSELEDGNHENANAPGPRDCNLQLSTCQTCGSQRALEDTFKLQLPEARDWRL
jgi:hypothetical protein